MGMANNIFDRSSLRLSAMLLLGGQLLYVVITLLHTGGEANHHAAIFAAYAASATWTAVHVAQFACMAIMLAGLLALFSAMDGPTGATRLTARLGAASRCRPGGGWRRAQTGRERVGDCSRRRQSRALRCRRDYALARVGSEKL
jgi:hypothetical protein